MDIVTLAERAQEAASLEEKIFYIIVGCFGAVLFITFIGLLLIYAERKICAHIQCRLGPMRVGFHGILQPLADGIKLLFKEDIHPKNIDRIIYVLASLLTLLATFLTLVIIPFSPHVQIIDLNIGVIYLLAVSGFGILGILLAGWSSNNKWSLLGAMRAGAQMISYEISTILSLLVIVMLSGSLKLSEIIQSQENGWWIWRAPIVGLVAFLIFMVASCAELNRTPFDLAEGESELTAGYHTEYSGLRFSLFLLAEFLNMVLLSMITVTFFLGGWMPFHFGDVQIFNSLMDVIPPVIWFVVKTAGVIFLFMWFRWTFPRLRVDQLMKLEWKFLMPIGFVNLFVVSFMVIFQFYFFP